MHFGTAAGVTEACILVEAAAGTVNLHECRNTVADCQSRVVAFSIDSYTLLLLWVRSTTSRPSERIVVLRLQLFLQNCFGILIGIDERWICEYDAIRLCSLWRGLWRLSSFHHIFLSFLLLFLFHLHGQ